MYSTGIWWCAMLAAAAEAVTRHPLVLVVSFDGFRPDYVRPDVTPHLARLRSASAAPPYMRNVFPTKTFVNHFTMATGLYPETHGVLDNTMFDPLDKQPMHYTYKQFHYDESVVPIWMLNEYNGDGRYSGVMMWAGSEYSYQNKKPTYIEKYNKSVSWTSRVDKIIKWINDKERPANLVLAYFEEPDNTGHTTGVGSQEIKNQIVRVDTTVKYLLDQIKTEKLQNKINLIILSDHGMQTVTYDGMIFLDNYLTSTNQEIISTGPNAFILPKEGKYDEVYKNLSRGANISGKFYVYKQDQLLDRWHMKNSPRLNGIIYLLAKPSYAFWDTYFETILNKTTKGEFRIGTHGYDNEDPMMRAIFMASGPAFKENFAARPFDNVDLYPLIARLTDMKDGGKPVNGTIDGVEQLLKRPLSTSGAAAVLAPLQCVQGIWAATLLLLLLHAFTRLT